MAEIKWLRNTLNSSATGPRIEYGLFRAGADQAIVKGQMLERTYSTNTTFVPWDSDFDATGTDDCLAVAACDIKSGDRAGWYPVIVPQPGDVFEAPLAAASSMAIGTALTYSSATALTTGGTYPAGYACGMDNYPKQGHASDDASVDVGSTVRSTSYVQFSFKTAVSYYKIFEQ